MQGALENEVKIAIGDPSPMVDRLNAAGFRLFVDRRFEANTLYDTPDGRLRAQEMIIRLREVGDEGILTFKGPGAPGPHKSREEIETSVGSLDQLHRILQKLGYNPAFRYEKYRTEFKHPVDNRGVVTLDETPIGNFLELEGPGEWIDSTAQQLGFSPGEYILDSYGKLYLNRCKERRNAPAHMTFSQT